MTGEPQEPRWEPTRRLKSCVEAWPECVEGTYDPQCCRFPKSCSCTVYRDDIPDEKLESPAAPVAQEPPAPMTLEQYLAQPMPNINRDSYRRTQRAAPGSAQEPADPPRDPHPADCKGCALNRSLNETVDPAWLTEAIAVARQNAMNETGTIVRDILPILRAGIEAELREKVGNEIDAYYDELKKRPGRGSLEHLAWMDGVEVAADIARGQS